MKNITTEKEIFKWISKIGAPNAVNEFKEQIENKTELEVGSYPQEPKLDAYSKYRLELVSKIEYKIIGMAEFFLKKIDFVLFKYKTGINKLFKTKLSENIASRERMLKQLAYNLVHNQKSKELWSKLKPDTLRIEEEKRNEIGYLYRKPINKVTTL